MAKTIDDLTDGGDVQATDVVHGRRAGADVKVSGLTPVDTSTVAAAGALMSSQLGAANGVAPLDASSKLAVSYLPSQIVGALNYQGTWNANTNTPSLSNQSGDQGHYYTVSVAGTTSIDGENDWNVGDMIVSNGTAWEKVDNTDAVTSVAGRQGDVTLTLSDIGDAGTMAALSAPSLGLSNQTATGIIMPATVDVNAQGFGAPLTVASDGNLETADADQSTTMPVIALAVETGTGTKNVLLHGIIRNDAWDWTPRGIVYVSTTTGALTQTPPSGTGDIVQVVGIAITADIILFNPSYDMIEV